jgi:glutamyl endopeptidase
MRTRSIARSINGLHAAAALALWTLAGCAQEPLDPGALDLWDAGAGEPSLAELDELPEIDFADDEGIDPADVPAEIMDALRDEPIEKAIIGRDTRRLVGDTRVAPYRSVVQVLTQWKKGAAAVPCTGTMVAADAVLTAAHCLYNSSRTETGYPYSVVVVPGLYPKSPVPASGTPYSAPFGVSYAKKLFVPDRFKLENQNAWNRIPFDFAVIRLKVALPAAGKRGYGVHEEPIVEPTVLLGYHDDRQACLQMYESRDRVRQVLSNGTINHYTDLKPGASGAGIVSTGAWANKVFAIQSSHIDAGNRYNIATLITSDKLRSISSWVTRAL